MDLRYINPYYLNNNIRRNSRSSTYSLFQSPIYDRTAEDVNTVISLIQKGYNNFTDEEKALWNTNLKGALNVSDLNRIENNMGIIANVVEVIITIKSWSITDIPYEEDFQRIHDNLILIRDSDIFADLPLTPVPELPYNDYDKINAIEKLLKQMYDNLNRQFYCFCTDRPNYNTLNQLYSGEPIQ